MASLDLLSSLGGLVLDSSFVPGFEELSLKLLQGHCRVQRAVLGSIQWTS